jgi:protocatechuate 3,4-dioxygenase beta subunit
MLYKLIITLIISSFCFNVFAKSPEEALRRVKEIPPIINYYPYSTFSFEDERIKWNSFNNLRRKSGSAFYAIGEPLFLEGYITDVNDVPIDNVQIKLIQANANGVYDHLIEKTDALYDANFANNGITITDNRGYYRFLTVFPGYYNNRAPHLHVVFEHAKYGRIETEIFFENHPRNAGDPKYRRLTENQKKNVTAFVYFINPKEKELGKKVVFNLIFNTNQTTKTI